MSNEIVRRKLVRHRRGDFGARLRSLYGLTPAEWRAVEGLLTGLRPAEIAVSLGISVHTIRTQLKRAMAKASVHSQAALVARAFVSKR